MSKTLLLNMIVKNEADIIQQTLSNLCDNLNFAYWVISDTGSTDNTKELIQDFFKEKGIPGELHEDVWKDFGYNRTKALEYAFNKSDLLMTFDADDQIIGNLKVPRNIDFDICDLKMTFSDNHTFFRTLIVNNRRKWKYDGKIHEYITPNDNLPITNAIRLIGDYSINARSAGARNKNPNKLIEDVNTIVKAFNELKEDEEFLAVRYAYHAAVGYSNLKLYDDAIEWFNKVITKNISLYKTGIFCSHIYLSEIYFLIKNQLDYAIVHSLKSYLIDNTRVEGISNIIQYYTNKEMYDLAYSYYLIIKDTYEDKNVLITDIQNEMIYNFRIPSLMIKISMNLKKLETIVKMYEIIFTKKALLTQDRIDIFMDYFNTCFESIIHKIDVSFYDKLKEYIIFLEKNNIKISKSFYYDIFQSVH